jgi:TRAP-type transport system periplasmic protein
MKDVRLRLPHLISLIALLLLPRATPSLISAQTHTLRISLDNAPDHVQVRGVRRFAAELERRSGGRFAASVVDSGRLARDGDVFRALQQGRVEMAVPGTWHVSRHEPAVGVFLLPAFYGRHGEEVHRYTDGDLGSVVNGRIEESLGVVVPGRWMDLGAGQLFFVGREVRNYPAIREMTIRVAGGPGNELRIVALGAHPLTIPWSDLPEMLRHRSIDGLLTTYETVRTGRLWEFGVTHALEDDQYFAQYVPLVRRSFWEALSPDDRDLFRRVWDEAVTRQRVDAARAQARSRAALAEAGIRIAVLSEEAREAARRRLLAEQPRIAATLAIPPDVLELLDDPD